MAWNKSGEERVKSYRIYKELEERYNQTLSELEHYKAMVRLKDATIRNLAAELAATPALGEALKAPISGTTLPQDEPTPAVPAETQEKPRESVKRASGVLPKVSGPGLAKTGVPLSKLFGGGNG